MLNEGDIRFYIALNAANIRDHMKRIEDHIDDPWAVVEHASAILQIALSSKNFLTEKEKLKEGED